MDIVARSHRLSRALPEVCRMLEVTQRQLAQHLGVRDVTVWKWKYKGQNRRFTRPMLEWFERLCKEQAIDPEELLLAAEARMRAKWKGGKA